MLEKQSEILMNEIDQTESQLASKLETLEEKVLDVVQGTTSTVQETVEAAKETVHETVEAVQSTMHSLKEQLDLRHQVDRHPWPMMVASAAAGFALYHLATALQSKANLKRDGLERPPLGGSSLLHAVNASPGVVERMMTHSFVPVLQGFLTGLSRELVHAFTHHGLGANVASEHLDRRSDDASRPRDFLSRGRDEPRSVVRGF